MDSRDTCSQYIWWESIDESKQTAVPKKFIFDRDPSFIHFTYEVCPECQGKGSYVNPSIDSHGISGDEWNEWEPEERKSYMRGDYDITCQLCHGKRVVPTPAQDHFQKELDRYYDDIYQANAEREAERRMGC